MILQQYKNIAGLIRIITIIITTIKSGQVPKL